MWVGFDGDGEAITVVTDKEERKQFEAAFHWQKYDLHRKEVKVEDSDA